MFELRRRFLRATGAIPACVAGLLALACSSVEVATEVAQGADPAQFATFHALPPLRSGDARDTYTPDVLERVRAEIESILTEKGYRAAPLGSAELHVTTELVGVKAVRRVVEADPDANAYVNKPFVDSSIVIRAAEASSGDTVWLGRGTASLVTTGRLVTTNVAAASAQKAREVMAAFPGR